MPSVKQFKQMERGIAQQRRAVAGLNLVVRDIERCEKTLGELQKELQSINSRYQGPRTTREDIAYLTGLLKCANRKLVWEKQIASLQKRTPVILETVSRLMNDPDVPADHQVRADMLKPLQAIQAAMERLQSARTD